MYDGSECAAFVICFFYFSTLVSIMVGFYVGHPTGMGWEGEIIYYKSTNSI